MPAAPTVAAERLSAIRYSAAQTRIIDATLPLFGDHGVSGTSLQMIADRLGVTKAAVHHQFPTKDEIVAMAAGGLISVGADPAWPCCPTASCAGSCSPRPAGGRGAHLVAGPARGHRPETPRPSGDPRSVN